MKQATMPLYIRFGDIPDNQESSTYFPDTVVRSEGGLSVYRAIKANECYFPMLPEEANEAGVADYFDFLRSDRRVYLVTGDEMRLEGSDREPLLIPGTVKIIKEITPYCQMWKGTCSQVERTVNAT